MNEKKVQKLEDLDFDSIPEDQARLLYKIKIQDIRYSKTLQWRVVYFSILALVGILAVLFSSEPLCEQLKYSLLAISFLIYPASSWLIINYRRDIHVYREVKDKCQKRIFDLSGPPPLKKDEIVFCHIFLLAISLTLALILVMIFEMQTVSIRILAAVLLLHVFGFLLDYYKN